MYEMNGKKRQKIMNKKRMVNTAKECAYLAVFTALVIATQLVFAAVPGVELVTVLFISYAFVFGWKRGMATATVFSLLRQFIFGVYPTVLILYIVYYNFLALLFGFLGVGFGKKMTMRMDKKTFGILCLIVVISCIATMCFTMFDNILTSLWYGYSERAREAYFYASLPVMTSQTICSAVSVSVLFLPLRLAFLYVKKGLH